jgi:predicted metallopeptidase
MDRVAVACSQTRKRIAHGLYATLTPMRFEGGRTSTVRRGRQFTAQRLFDVHGRELLYILRFYLPRFMETDLLCKLTTIIHELWHISPEFDGDLRRHGGRCYVHTQSQKQFDGHMQRLACRYVAGSPPEQTVAFLRLSFRQLTQQYGRVYGIRVPQPKLIPVG